MTSLRKDGNVAYFPSLRSVVSFLLALWLGLIIFKRPLVGGPNVVSSLPGVVLIDHSSIVAQGSRNGARVASSWGPRAAAAAGRREPLWDDYLGPHDLVDYDYPPKRLPRDEAGPAVEALHGLTPLPAGQACLPALEKDWPSLLGKAELRAFSQNEEDGVLLGILLNIGVASKYYVEFGTEDGSQCNTRVLREWLSWQGLLMDGSHERPEINLRRQVVTPDNINALLTTYVLESATASGRPHDPKAVIDVLSIDLDFSDWWVWRAVNGSLFQPRVVLVEHNAGIPPNVSATVDLEDSQRWTGTNYFGASLAAMVALGRQKGYTLVHVESQGVNAIFVRSDVLECQGVTAPPLEQLHRSPRYGAFARGHPVEQNASRPWVYLDDQGQVLRKGPADWQWLPHQPAW